MTPRIGKLIKHVATRHHVRVENVLGRERVAQYVAARQSCMWYMRVKMGMTYPSIARVFDRDHKTVMHGVKAHERRVAQ